MNYLPVIAIGLLCACSVDMPNVTESYHTINGEWVQIGNDNFTIDVGDNYIKVNDEYYTLAQHSTNLFTLHSTDGISSPYGIWLGLTSDGFLSMYGIDDTYFYDYGKWVSIGYDEATILRIDETALTYSYGDHYYTYTFDPYEYTEPLHTPDNNILEEFQTYNLYDSSGVYVGTTYLAITETCVFDTDGPSVESNMLFKRM